MTGHLSMPDVACEVIMFDHNCLLQKRRTCLVLNLLTSFAILLTAIPIQSQEKKEPKKSADEEDLIRVTTNLVSFDVMVKDKKGKAITNLKAEDFTITENGVPQKIEHFESTLSNGNDPARSLTVESQPGKPPNRMPRNIISLVLDGQTTEGANLKHVREGVTRYIRDRVQDSDSVALFAISR